MRPRRLRALPRTHQCRAGRAAGRRVTSIGPLPANPKPSVSAHEVPAADVPRPVRLWRGRADWQAPLPGVRLLAAVMPTADLRVLHGTGYLLEFTYGVVSV